MLMTALVSSHSCQTGAFMNRYIVPLIFTLAFALTSHIALAIMIVTVSIGDAGNPNDPATGNLYGGVNYNYNIDKFEVDGHVGVLDEVISS